MFAVFLKRLPNITCENFKAEIFAGPDYEKFMNETQKQTWASFKRVIQSFLLNNKC